MHAPVASNTPTFIKKLPMSSSLPCAWAAPILPSSSSSSSYSSSRLLYSNPTARENAKPKRRISCNTKNDNQNAKSSYDSQGNNTFDRRDALIGLGGLYGAASSINPLESSAAPIPPPELNNCRTATNINGQPVPYSCCPPINNRIVDFRLPARPVIRTRPAAHLANAEYISRFNLALQRMRDLPDSDPRSFMQQANVHCSYCNGAYTYPSATGSQRLEIQVHNCGLFFPFHRWYLYFFERILGSLINDPPFAMPYWNHGSKSRDMKLTGFQHVEEHSIPFQHSIHSRGAYRTLGINIPWVGCPPRARVTGTRAGRTVEAPKLEAVEFPLKLDKVVKVLVPRPKKSRSKEEKDKEEEVLLISDIEVDTEKFVKFDVFVDEEENDYAKLAKAEYTGTFAQVPHKHETPLQIKTSRYLELTQQLEDLGVEDDDEILVTLVPRAGDITIGGIKIVYSPSNQ
ncbi:UNVERIFIED_CONTAM: Polyphenol oxidase, chloroplastic [Sesamum angustifolium]|uniref:Polyphenol oxidase, chloroplastic n=1 Tax=Sesamum angustifolium TaxID=2727405 RepID=A0AAW2KUY8_9LAMI